MEIKINVADVVLCEFYLSDLKRSFYSEVQDGG